MSAVIWSLYLGAILLGVVMHEVAHWLVWALAGRRPSFGLRSVQPRAGPAHTTAADRCAAAAPYALGVASILGGLWLWELLLFGFGWGLIRIPSKVDIETMRGNAEWMLPG